MSSFPLGLRHADMGFLLSLMFIGSTQSASPPHTRPDFTLTIIKRNGSDAAMLPKQDSDPFLQLTIALNASFAALLLVLLIWLMCSGRFQGVGQRIKRHVLMNEGGQDGGPSTMHSVASDTHISRSKQQPEWQSQALGATASGPAPTIMVTSTDPNETLLGRASTEAATSLPSNSAALYTGATLTTAVSPALNAPLSLSQLTLSSSLDATNGSIRTSDTDGTPEMEMIPLRASRGSEHIRTLLIPSPTPSSNSMSDHLTSLIEFPSPPAGPFLPPSDGPSSPLRFPGDLGDLNGVRSPVSPQAEFHPDSVLVADPAPPDPSHADLDDALSTTSTRPPTYHSGWHRSGFSQSSISTLPVYSVVEGDANTADRGSRPRSSRSSASNPRDARTTLVRPPLPVPPFPLGFSLKNNTTR